MLKHQTRTLGSTPATGPQAGPMDLSWSLQNVDLSASLRAAEWAAQRAAQANARAFAPQAFRFPSRTEPSASNS